MNCVPAGFVLFLSGIMIKMIEKKKEKRRASPSLSFFIGDQIPNTALQYIA